MHNYEQDTSEVLVTVSSIPPQVREDTIALLKPTHVEGDIPLHPVKLNPVTFPAERLTVELEQLPPVELIIIPVMFIVTEPELLTRIVPAVPDMYTFSMFRPAELQPTTWAAEFDIFPVVVFV
jgi:hypothetical protein